MLMNDELFQNLPPHIQRIIQIAARQGAIADRAVETMNSKVKDLEVIAREMELYSPTAEEIEQFRKVAQKPVIEWLKKEMGPEIVGGMLQAVQEAERALGLKR